MLGRDEVVLELAHLVLAAVEHAGERGRGTGLLLGAADARLWRERCLGLRAQGGYGRAGTLDEGPGKLLVEQREHEVLRIDLGVPAAPREFAGAGDGLLGFDGQAVEIHG